MSLQRNKPSSSMNNQGNRVTLRQRHFSRNQVKVTEDCDLRDRDFKIAAMKNLSEIQENSRGSSVSSGVKLMNRRSTLSRIWKLQKRSKPKSWSWMKNSRNEIKNGHFNNSITQRKQVAIKDAISLPPQSSTIQVMPRCTDIKIQIFAQFASFKI